MVRPREFDRDTALEHAIQVFWMKGFAATSTEDLLQAMGIGRQSLYNAFGDKRRLYLEALAAYQQRSTADHVKRLCGPVSPLIGIEDLLCGLIADDDRLRAMGCMGVGAIGEFGPSDPELAMLRAKVARLLGTRLLERIREGQKIGVLDRGMDPKSVASLIQVTMAGIQLAARAGAGAKELRKIARFTVDRLKA